MALRMGALQDALMNPGDQDLARKAAEEVAAYDKDLAGLRLEVRIGSVVGGVNTLLLIGVLWVVVRLSETVAGLSATVAGLAAKLP